MLESADFFLLLFTLAILGIGTVMKGVRGVGFSAIAWISFIASLKYGTQTDIRVAYMSNGSNLDVLSVMASILLWLPVSILDLRDILLGATREEVQKAGSLLMLPYMAAFATLLLISPSLGLAGFIASLAVAFILRGKTEVIVQRQFFWILYAPVGILFAFTSLRMSLHMFFRLYWSTGDSAI